MRHDVVTGLLPVLGRSLARDFNVFDVMHHGTHEKQLSNVFAWLLDAAGTHNLGTAFLDNFIQAINRVNTTNTALPLGKYRVHQEVNTAQFDETDIADIVLEHEDARIVVENYYTSDGHGHSYQQYSDYSILNNKRGAVVLLCRNEDKARLTQGWEQAAVLTYSSLIEQLYATLHHHYRRENPDATSFIEQLHRKFVAERKLVNESDVLEFVNALVETGEAERYSWVPHDQAAEEFASAIATQARQRFVEGRELLAKVKEQLRTFCEGPLTTQLHDSLGPRRALNVSADLRGVYQWSVDVEITGFEASDENIILRFMFGPTAKHEHREESVWNSSEAERPDFTHVFVGRTDQLVMRQSTVSLQHVLDGMEATDRRLYADVIALDGA